MSDFRDLRNMNLNLLPVLRELLRHASVTGAAKVLHVSQSSVSASLKALREHFDDELLVTVGRETVLTSLAKELLPALEHALSGVQGVLQGRPFDPNVERTHFLIGALDYVGAILAPGLASDLQHGRSGLTAQLTQVTLASFEALSLGDIDLLISEATITERAMSRLGLERGDFERQRLWVDELVAMCREGLDLDPNGTLESYLARPHATFRLEPTFAGSLDETWLQADALSRNDRVMVANVHLLPLIAARTDCVTLVPESLAHCYQQALPLQLFRAPLGLPPIRVEMLWMRRDTQSTRHAWLREWVAQIVRETDFLRD